LPKKTTRMVLESAIVAHLRLRTNTHLDLSFCPHWQRVRTPPIEKKPRVGARAC
jgi:hypothetical protein